MRLKSIVASAVAVTIALVAAGPLEAGVSKVEGGIEFTFDDPSAGSVSLAGDFNNWNMNAEPLTKGDDGVWRVVVELAPGDYEYKFVVNGSEWVADPDNPRVVGDYGNSGLTVNDAGEPVTGGAGSAISNTPANSRVMLNGWYRATYDTQSDVPSDPRWRLNRPAHEIYLQVNPTVTSVASGSATLRLTTGAGDIKEIAADLYSGHATLEGGPFSVTGFYNEELVQYDDPLETVGHMDLDYTIPEEHIPFGRGAQGIILDTGFWGFDLTATYANVYDYYIMNDPSVYDNTDTDLVAARLKRGVGPATLGVTYTSWKDGWWIDWTGTNSSPQIDEYRANHPESQSDWFEFSRTETWTGVDVALPLAGGLLEAQAEYARYGFDSLFDMGNREKVEGEDYSNGAIDVPVGDTDGWAGKVVLSSSPLPALDLRLEATKRSIEPMDEGELYVAYGTPEWLAEAQGQFTEVRYDGSPLSVNVFGPSPERDELEIEFDARFTLGIFDLGIECHRGSYDWTYVEPLAGIGGEFSSWAQSTSRFAGTAGVSLSDRLHVGVSTESRATDYDDVLWQDPGRWETIVTADVGLSESWDVIVDLRSIAYDNVARFAESTPDSISYGDDSFFAPYVALVYSPRENVEFRVGYGVNPTNYTDTPVEGRANGRERWLSQYLWEHSAYDILDAEQALSDARTIGLMALITF